MSTAGLTVALAGNPNSGKTTIFNNITGSSQHVGNYAGVTVERREGFRRFRGKDMLLVDLPGTYSLTAHSLDELVARNVIIDEKPDIVVNVLDASNLERNLYLAIQLLELDRPMILALNMTDVAKTMGISLNDELLSSKLGIPVVRTVGNRNIGTEDLLATVSEAAMAKSAHPSFRLDYGKEIEEKIQQVSEALTNFTTTKYPTRWLAIRLLESDKDVQKAVSMIAGGDKVLAVVDDGRNELGALLGEEVEIAIAQQRYRFVGEVCGAVVQTSKDSGDNLSDKIDSVLTHRVVGLPLFFGIMWLLFNVVFTIGAYPQEMLEEGVEWFGAQVSTFLPDGQLKSLVVDGIIAGVGSVIVFLPNILLLFFGIALLEGTGYMARAAFVMDRVMRAVGLHGKAFIPLLIGFGCTVPAIMGTRTLENPRDRIVTILVSPLMSCSAKLPVYTLLTAAFFAENIAGTVLFSVYLIGILLAVLMAMIFRKWLFPGVQEAFVMEMPPYHLPTLRSIATHMWGRSALYIKKAGTLILAASILVWFATTYPSDVAYSRDYDQAQEQVTEVFNVQVAGLDSSDTLYIDFESKRDEELAQLENAQASEKLAASYAGIFGKTIEPVIQPLGFDWKIGVGLFTAMAAKEVLVSTLGTIYSVGGGEEDSVSLSETMAADPTMSPLVAFTLMIFTLIYAPCIAALAVVKRETNSWKWPIFSFAYSTTLAWVVCFVIYQTGILLGY